jgi:hypothetical protein
MDYLVLIGGDLQEVFSNVLGGAAPFFWSTAAPIGLAILWLLSVHALLASWFQTGGDSEDHSGGGSVFVRLLFSLVLAVVILSAGSAFEFLVFGGGFVHSQLLAGALTLVRPG